jgi:hypothetical protein
VPSPRGAIVSGTWRETATQRPASHSGKGSSGGLAGSKLLVRQLHRSPSGPIAWFAKILPRQGSGLLMLARLVCCCSILHGNRVARKRLRVPDTHSALGWFRVGRSRWSDHRSRFESGSNQLNSVTCISETHAWLGDTSIAASFLRHS